MNKKKTRYSSGAVSIYVVIIASLLITVVTVGFIQLIIKGQQQASQNDLAQSAYDSALAGVEDAKRALVIDEKCEENDNVVAGADCEEINTALNSGDCNTLRQIFYDDTAGETPVMRQGEEDDRALNQAYTCVKVLQNTPNYRRSGLTSDRSHLIPLRTAPATSFNRIEITWFTSKDAGIGDDVVPSLTYPSVDFPFFPPSDDQWGGEQTPPLLRAQLIQTDRAFSLADFDTEPTDSQSNANTLFLYPYNAGSDQYSFGTDDRHQEGKNQPHAVICNDTQYANGGYACKVTILLPNPVGTSDSTRREAFLRLSALYNTTRYQITLKNGNTPVDFYGVQAEVDATGRANDLFRRVNARVDLHSTDFPFPEQAVYLYGSLCKDFWVTNNPEHFKTEGCAVTEVEEEL